MKVQITYTIDLKDLPNEVIKLLSNFDVPLVVTSNFEKIRATIKENNPTGAIEKILEFREYLMNLDLRLNDCVKLLEGYQKALSLQTSSFSSDTLPEENQQPKEENLD